MLDIPPPASNMSEAHYHSLLVRLWREDPDAPWRFWVQDTTTGQQCFFSNMDYLVDFLHQQIDDRHEKTS